MTLTIEAEELETENAALNREVSEMRSQLDELKSTFSQLTGGKEMTAETVAELAASLKQRASELDEREASFEEKSSALTEELAQARDALTAASARFIDPNSDEAWIPRLYPDGDAERVDPQAYAEFRRSNPGREVPGMERKEPSQNFIQVDRMEGVELPSLDDITDPAEYRRVRQQQREMLLDAGATGSGIEVLKHQERRAAEAEAVRKAKQLLGVD